MKLTGEASCPSRSGREGNRKPARRAGAARGRLLCVSAALILGSAPRAAGGHRSTAHCAVFYEVSTEVPERLRITVSPIARGANGDNGVRLCVDGWYRAVFPGGTHTGEYHTYDDHNCSIMFEGKPWYFLYDSGGWGYFDIWLSTGQTASVEVEVSNPAGRERRFFLFSYAGGTTNQAVPDQDYCAEPNAEALAFTRDPINTINGNVRIRETDIALPAPGLPLLLTRTYNSDRSDDGPLGPNWTHSLDWRLQPEVTQLSGIDFVQLIFWMVVRTGSGERYWFRQSGVDTNVYDSPFDNNWTLRATNGIHELSMPARRVLRFDCAGWLSSLSDAWGNTISLSYTNTGSTNLLLAAEHSNGLRLDFAYAGTRLVRVDTPAPDFRMHYTYDAGGRLVAARRQTSRGEACIGYAYASGTYDDPSCLTQRVNAAGQVFAYDYEQDVFGGLTRVGGGMRIDGQYYDQTVAWDDDGHESTVTYRRGAAADEVWRYAHDPAMRRVTSIATPAAGGPALRLARNAAGDITRETLDPGSGRSEFTVERAFGDDHNVARMAVGYGAEPTQAWACAWDRGWKLPTRITDPEGHVTEFDYQNGSLRRLRRLLPTGSQETSFSYGPGGLLTGITNACGHGLRLYYDARGFPTSAVPQAGPAVGWAYDALGNLAEVLLPGPGATPRTVAFETDERGAVHGITYPDGSRESFGYDPLGNLTNHVDPAGRVTACTYAPTRRWLSLTRTLEGPTNAPVTVSCGYDRQLNVLRVTDPLGREVESYELDEENRPVRVRNLEGQWMSVVYSVGRAVERLTRFDGTVLTNGYDRTGRIRCVDFADVTNRFGYYANGILRTAENEMGVVRYTIDAIDRIQSAAGTAPSGTVTYTFLPNDRVWTMESVAGTTEYAYDEAERVTRISAPQGVFSFSYDAANGLVAGVAYPNGVTVSNGYDVLDRLAARVWRTAAGEVLAGFAYACDAAGMITNVGRANGERLAYCYDSLDRLTSVVHRTAGGDCLLEECYGYDLAGNRTHKSHEDLAVGYAYAPAAGNRVAGWQASKDSRVACADVFSYGPEAAATNPVFTELWIEGRGDPAPRPLATVIFVDGAPPRRAAPARRAAVRDAAGHLVYLTDSAQVRCIDECAYDYSPAGCVTQITFSGAGYRRTMGLGWNGRYQLTSAAMNGHLTAIYNYDALGRRCTVANGEEEEEKFACVYDGMHVIADVDHTGRPRRTYLYGPGMDQVLGMTVHESSGNKVYYFVTDHLGSVHGVLDETGAVCESYRYDPWGRVSVFDGSGQPVMRSRIGNRILWQGREYCWETGLYYFRARWYDPVTGRWLSKDPIGLAGGLNQYVFCGNSAVNSRDPFGLLTDEQLKELGQHMQRSSKEFERIQLTYLGIVGVAVAAPSTAVTVANVARAGTAKLVATGAASIESGRNVFSRLAAWQPLQGLVNSTSIQGSYLNARTVTAPSASSATFAELVTASHPYVTQYGMGLVTGPGGPYRNAREFASWAAGAATVALCDTVHDFLSRQECDGSHGHDK